MNDVLCSLEQSCTAEQREALQALDYERERLKKALRNIKTFADAYADGNVTLTSDAEDADYPHRVYDIKGYMGSIRSNAYEGLGLPVPRILAERR